MEMPGLVVGATSSDGLHQTTTATTVGIVIITGIRLEHRVDGQGCCTKRTTDKSEGAGAADFDELAHGR